MGLKSKNWFKSPWGPAILSAVVAPGAGQMVNREYKKGIAFFLAFFGVFMWFSKVVTDQLSLALAGNPDHWYQEPEKLREAILSLISKNTDMFTTFYLLIFLLWGFSVVDAYLVVRRRQKQLPPTSLREDIDTIS